jgi:hypothetical protein
MKNLTKIFFLAALAILATNSNTPAYAQAVVAPGTQGDIFTSSTGATDATVETGLVQCGCAVRDMPASTVETHNIPEGSERGKPGLHHRMIKNTLISGCPMVEMCIPDTYCVIRREFKKYIDGKFVSGEVVFGSINCFDGSFAGWHDLE